MSFSASLSGLSANQQKLKVIGNNLANLNTVAFKASTVDFADLVYQSVGGSSANPAQIGLGVTTGAISPNFRQGGIENTGVPTNVAIQGSGFFVIGGGEGEAYTRAGNFSWDKDGMLVNAEGRPVLGYTATDANGNIITTGAPSPIIVPPGVLRTPVTTTSSPVGMNKADSPRQVHAMAMNTASRTPRASHEPASGLSPCARLRSRRSQSLQQNSCHPICCHLICWRVGRFRSRVRALVST